MSGNGREAFPDVREWSKGPPKCPGVVGRPYRMFGRSSRIFVSDREAHPDVRDALTDVRVWSVGLPGCPGVVRSHSRMSRSGRKALPDARE